MLADSQRVEFYSRAIFDNPEVFKDKIVLDVGSGLGILSMLAVQGGAKKVFAIEAAPKIAELCQKAVNVNGFQDKIEVINKKIEDIESLGSPGDKIDIIISEWMGYCLLYESMLPSVIFARDKFQPLNMIPNMASVHLCGFQSEEYFEVIIFKGPK